MKKEPKKEPKYEDAKKQARNLSDEELISEISRLGNGDSWDGCFTTRGANELLVFEQVATERFREIRQRITALEQQLIEAQENACHLEMLFNQARRIVVAVGAEHNRYKEALEFYANLHNYWSLRDLPNKIDNDCGDKARAALNGGK